MRSTRCSAASTGATTSSGSSTGRRSSRSTARSPARAGCSRRETVVSLGRAVNTYGIPGLAIVDAGPARLRSPPICCARSTASAIRAAAGCCCSSRWTHGAGVGREQHARVLRPLLPDAARGRRDRLLVDERPRHAGRGAGDRPRGDAVRAARRRAQRARGQGGGRDDAVRGSVLHWHEEDGRPVLSPPEIVGRVAASLRAVRRARKLSQHDLGDLAGVTASAISQVERAERGLSLATLVRLSAALRRHDRRPAARRGARRLPDRAPDRRPAARARAHAHAARRRPRTCASTSCTSAPRETGAPAARARGTGIVAVASGLVQVPVAGQTPAIRHGEVLVADSEQVAGWRNLGQSEAVLFWIVTPSARSGGAG